ncbi:antibiotic biosynthesis monooxygenase [Oscillospiraceae bacterium 44-5]
MSIVINLYYTGENGNARKFAEEMERSGTADLIRQESGNERYSYFFPMDDPETVLLIDIWKDQASIDMHHASPMMETIVKLREKCDLHMRAERYVTDTDGMPSADSQFIRR